MPVKSGEMIFQTAYLNGLFDVPGVGKIRIQIQGGWVNDEDAQGNDKDYMFGKAIMIPPGFNVFEDNSTDAASFGSIAADVADLKFVGTFGNAIDGKKPATLHVTVDDKADQFTFRLQNEKGDTVLQSTSPIAVPPRQIFVSQKFAPGLQVPVE